MKHNTAADRALLLLQRREHSKRELAEKLKARGFEENVDTVIETLAAQNLQSDVRFAECFVRARAAKGFGPMRITEELKAKGVDRQTITVALEEVEWQAVWQSQYQKLQKKYDMSTKEGQFKLKRALMLRGFTNMGRASLDD